MLHALLSAMNKWSTVVLKWSAAREAHVSFACTKLCPAPRQGRAGSGGVGEAVGEGEGAGEGDAVCAAVGLGVGTGVGSVAQ
jgi:hypothetical protein